MNQEIEFYKKQVKLGEALDRLEAVPEFKELIIEGYCQAASDSLVRLLSYQANLDMRNKYFDKLLSISHFRAYVEGIHSEAARAKEAIAQLEQSDLEGDDE